MTTAKAETSRARWERVAYQQTSKEVRDEEDRLRKQLGGTGGSATGD